MIIVTSKGSTEKTEKFLRMMKDGEAYKILADYGQKGVDALAAATPTDTGTTAHSWNYKVDHKGGWYGITWHNTNVVDGLPVAILIQLGHGTGTGGWVQGRDFINPVIQPLFDQIAKDVWEKVKHG